MRAFILTGEKFLDDAPDLMKAIKDAGFHIEYMSGEGAERLVAALRADPDPDPEPEVRFAFVPASARAVLDDLSASCGESARELDGGHKTRCSWWLGRMSSLIEQLQELISDEPPADDGPEQ